MLDSPLQQFCDMQDQEFLNLDISEYRSTAWKFTKKKGFEYTTNLLLDEADYRAMFGMNILASITGQQGRALKSLFGVSFCYCIGKSFGKPFDLQNNTVVDPWRIDFLLKNCERRTTFLIDEVQRARVGLMSNTIEFRLSDYEEQGRETQKNIVYCTPNNPREGHYFYFNEFNHTRKENKICEECHFQKECYFLGLYRTLCKEKEEVRKKLGLEKGLDFWERTGYPEKIQFELKTPTRYDRNLIVPRFIVELPAPTPRTLVEYQKIKSGMINRLEKDESDSWKILNDSAEKVFERYGKQLVWEKKNGEKRAIPDVRIKIKVFSVFGLNKFPNQAVDLLIQLTKDRVEKAIQQKEV